MPQALAPELRLRVAEAIERIASVPGYGPVARDLAGWLDAERIHFDPALADRAVVEWTGRVVLGPEPFEGPGIGLEETLVHEHHHRMRQRNLMKSASFWAGVATRSHVMARYERPAYRAALAYLEAAAAARPDIAPDASREAEAVRRTWDIVYAIPLVP